MFMGYLREGPKYLRREFYDYEYALEEIAKSIESREILAILGIRRIGKTSLVLTAYSESLRSRDKLLLIHADFRGINSREQAYTIVLRGYRTSYTIAQAIGKSGKYVKRFDRELRSFLAEEIRTSSTEIDPKVVRVSNSLSRRLKNMGVLASFRDLFEVLDHVCGRVNTRCIVFLDEIHEVFEHVKESRSELAEALAYTYDYLSNLKVIVSGSRVRLLEEFLSHEALVGRIHRVYLKPLEPEKTIDMLSKALEQNNVFPDPRALGIAYSLTWGIPGWITDFGRRYVEGYRMYRDAIKAIEYAKQRVLEDMESICREELSVLKRYCRGVYPYQRSVEVLKAIAIGIEKFGELSKYTNLNAGMLSNLLEKLQRYGFIEKVGDRYRIADPSMQICIGIGPLPMVKIFEETWSS